MPRDVAISGFTTDEVLALSDADLAELVFCNEPFLFRIGSARILGEFRLTHSEVILEVAAIEGGGEGVLPTLSSLARRYAQTRGFVVETLAGVSAYHLSESVEQRPSCR